MSPEALRVLTASSRAALDSTGQATAGLVRRLWDVAVPGLDDAALEGYLGRAVPLVSSGQRVAAQAVARTTASLLEASGSLPAVMPTLVTAETPWLSSPMLRLRSLMAEGADYLEARDVAGRYAAALTVGDVQAAAREGAQQAAQALEADMDGPIAWTKIPAPGCCAWCERLSTRLFYDATSVAMHAADKCGFRPVTRAHDDFQFFSNSDTIFKNKPRGRLH